MPKQILSKEQILASSAKRKTEDVDIERLGGAVRLRELSSAEMFAFRRETKDVPDEESALHLVARCWVDGEGNRVFDGEGAIEAISSIPVRVLNELTQAVLSVNGLGSEAVEVAEKN